LQNQQIQKLKKELSERNDKIIDQQEQMAEMKRKYEGEIKEMEKLMKNR
jgi:hypothetical protein